MRPRPQLIAAAILAGLIGSPTAVMGGDSPTLAEFARTGDLLCHLRQSGTNTAAQRTGGMMLVIDEVGAKPGQARMLTSAGAGGKPVKVYSGETGVHLVQDVSGSVRVTSLIDCELRSSGGRCLRFSVVQAWHFDNSVHQDPDTAFRKLPGTSYAGTCEAWRMESIQSVGR